MGNSTHKVEIIKINKIAPHPNADRLGVVFIYGYSVCVNLADWKEGQLAAYIPPDNICDSSRPEFAFLKGHERIKVKKLRGIVSMGLLVPAPEGAKEGDDVTEQLNVRHYDPFIPMTTGGDNEKAPEGLHPQYDLDSLRRYAHVFEKGELVYVTEKIHGCLIYNTGIRMADGSRKRIGTLISENAVGQQVLGKDGTGRIIPSKILNVYDNGFEEDWIEVKSTRISSGRGNHFAVAHCTQLHEFWLPEKNALVAAKDLKIGDTVLCARTDFTISYPQSQVLLGKLIGDGSLQPAKNRTSAAVVYSHKEAAEGYIDWTIKVLGDMASTNVESYISGYGSEMKRCRTVTSPLIWERFSTFIQEEKRIIPSWVSEELGPMAIAVWYMDDGSLGHSEDQEDRATFHTCSESFEDCMILIKGLNKFGISASIKKYPSRDYYDLRLTADEAEKLFILIAPYIVPCMQYKLPERYRGMIPWFPGNNYKPSVIEQKITAIKFYKKRQKRYDIETETHNFFAGDILVHNSNARYCWQDGAIHCGSRTNWKKDDPKSVWWIALRNTPELLEFCKQHPDITVYGEVYGMVKNFRYGIQNQDGVRFAAFDLLQGSTWLNPQGARELGSQLPWVPTIDIVNFDLEHILSMAEGDSTIPNANHIREGIVISPLIERSHPEIGRIKLKIVSNAYLEKS